MTVALAFPHQPHSEFLAKLRTISLGLGGHGVIGLGLGLGWSSASTGILPAYVQSFAKSVYSFPFTISLPSLVTGGNFLLLSLGWGGSNNVSSVSDSLGNTWQSVTSRTGSSSRYLQTWYATNCFAGSTEVTVTWTNTPSMIHAALYEVSGIASSDALGGTRSYTSSISVKTLVTDFVETPVNSFLIATHVLSGGSGGNETVLPDWTLRHAVSSRGFVQDRVVLAGSSNNAGLSWTTSRTATAQIVAFKGQG